MPSGPITEAPALLERILEVAERVPAILAMLPMPMLETVLMVFASAFFACLLGFPLGVFLQVASPTGFAPLQRPKRLACAPPPRAAGFRPFLREASLYFLRSLLPGFLRMLWFRFLQTLYGAASQLVNLFRSIPFIILMILLIPLTRAIVGTSIGPVAAVVPLSIAAAPFVARVTEAALGEVDAGVITAAKAMGSTRLQIVRKVLIREAMPALVSGLALTIINLIAYSAMAGAIGGRGLGDLAIRYGLHRFELDVMIGTVIAILVLVQVVQLAGTLISRRLLSKR